MADLTSTQDIKEVEASSLRAFLEKSLAAISQKQDSQFQKQDFQFQELKKLIAQKQDSQFQELKKLIISRTTTPRSSTADSEPDQVDTDLKSAEIPSFDGSTDQDEDHEHHPAAPNSNFIIDQEGTGSKLLPSPPPKWKYDVFVSFRGEDTRKGFVSHLFHAFKREGINCYRDVDGNERGQKVDSMLIEAIRHSKMAIVVLSRNYADSKWCLQELVETLSWNKQHCINGHAVLPIFYDVTASDVRHLRGMVGEAFGRCIAKNGQQKKDIWQNALQQAGTISSWSSNNRDEACTIQEIVEVLLERLAYSRNPFLIHSSIVPNDNVSHLRTMLDTANNDVVQTVGICGTDRVGKTTLAHVACVHLRNAFEGRVILLDYIPPFPRKEFDQDYLLQTQSEIAAQLLKDDKLLLLSLSRDVEKNFWEIRMKLSQNKVLIVLDDVVTLEQVEFVLGKDHEKFLGLGSRVVITSRDWGLLDKLKVDDIYMVPPLNLEDSLKLFYHYAFMGRQDAIKGYEELSKNIVRYAAGLPPALESLGCSLSNAPETEWHTKLRELVRSRNCGDSKLYRYGPFGGRGRVESRWDDGEYCDVSGIELVIVDSVIKSIGVTYNNYGHPVGPLFHGSSISSSTVFHIKIKFDYPYEYLMAISGYIGKTEANEVTVHSLTLHSNTRTLGPFGDESKTGRPFYTPKTGAKIVGFFGAGDSELQSIGVHAKQVSHTYPHHHFVGPFGENSIEGADWDHGAFTDIRKIIITKVSGWLGDLISISCVYDNNGLPVEKLSQHSQSSNLEQVEVTLNYPTEYIVSISGSYSQGSYVSSLTFRTNLKTYGPYGSEKDLTFSTPLELGKIVGFYGTEINGVCIQTIGVHLAPVYHMQPLTTIGPFGYVSADAWDDGKHNGVKRINIGDFRSRYRTLLLNYLRFTYVDGNGGTVQGRELFLRGGLDNGVDEVIELDYPKEYLVSISGRVRSPEIDSDSQEIDSDSNRITSLSFKTNLREFGPYGEITERDNSFSFKSDIAKIVGFHGTNSKHHGYSIGPHVQLL